MVAADGARVSMPKGKFVLMGTAVAGERHIAFLKEVAGGKSRKVTDGLSDALDPEQYKILQSGRTN